MCIDQSFIIACRGCATLRKWFPDSSSSPGHCQHFKSVLGSISTMSRTQGKSSGAWKMASRALDYPQWQSIYRHQSSHLTRKTGKQGNLSHCTCVLPHVETKTKTFKEEFQINYPSQRLRERDVRPNIRTLLDCFQHLLYERTSRRAHTTSSV